MDVFSYTFHLFSNFEYDMVNVNIASVKKRQSDFKSFYTQYDERRGLDFRATFDPMMVDWYDSLTPTRIFKIEAGNG